jgi:RND family efflux transporter MFP subunit
MHSRVYRIFLCLFVVPTYFSFSAVLLWGQDKTKGPPPANVVVAKVTTSLVAPQAEFIGTVFYQEVSDVASELSGLAEVVRFEEGQRVKKGQTLVELGSELMRKNLQATLLTHEQLLSELEIARIELKRKEKLFKKNSIAEQTYDQDRYRVLGLEKRAASLKAQVQRIEIELKKKIIRAPYNAVVIRRMVDRGEWISEGEEVAVLAKDSVVDIVVDVPERFIQYVNQGMQIRSMINGNEIHGKVFTIVPRGDIATRTFPVKIRTPNTYSLIEGMSAKVVLPTGRPKESLIVPRDSVISMFGQNVVFTVADSKAAMLPVKVIGYEGLSAGVEARGLQEGMQVVVQGNERLRNGQVVVVKNSDVR